MNERYSIDDLLKNGPLERALNEPVPEAENLFTGAVSPSALISGELQGNTIVRDGYLKSKNYVAGVSGWYLDPTTGEFNFAVSVDSLDIPDTVTANSFHVDTVGNSWWGATTLASALAYVTSAGLATFAGIAVLNGNAHTCFEASTRFTTTVAGSGTATFGTHGLNLATGATPSSTAASTWYVSQSVFGRRATISCTIRCVALNAATNTGKAYFGIGSSSAVFAGFYIEKTGGVVTLYGIQSDAGVDITAALTTLTDETFLELIFTVFDSGGVSFYFRKNSLALSAKTSLTGLYFPFALSNTMIFKVINDATATNFEFEVLSASYER